MSKPVNTHGWAARILLLAVALILVCACLSFADHYFMVYPTPENQSAFYKTYDPDHVLKPFISIHHLAHGGESSGGNAGRRAARLHREITRVFALQGTDRRDLTNLLSEDISSQLDRSGVQVTGMTGTEADGVQFRYVDKNGKGTVALRPVELVDPYEVRALSKSHPEKTKLPPLCDGEPPVSVTIVIDETWSKSGV
jgi:hypothetical protein